MTRSSPATMPVQAVILAGGLGVRMRPLTDSIPKPMIKFHGRPFLEYLVEQLRDSGVERIVMLLGYLPDVVQDHFGDGRRWGVSISYAVTPPEVQTGTRVRGVLETLDPVFLLLYCDNYWPMRLDQMWSRFVEADALALTTIYRNTDGYSRDNVCLDSNDRIVAYDRSRTTPGLRGVEIGYAILRRDVVKDLLPAEDIPFEEAVYPALAAQGRLQAYPTDHRYYGIGSMERLPATTEFLARRPTILLDRDGVLNERPPRAEYIRRPDEFVWLPGALEGAAPAHGRRLPAAGHLQPGGCRARGHDRGGPDGRRGTDARRRPHRRRQDRRCVLLPARLGRRLCLPQAAPGHAVPGST